MSQSQGCIIVDLPEDPQGLSQAKAHVQVDVIEAIPPEAKVMQVLKPDGHVTESSLDIKLTCNDVLFATLENETHCIVDGGQVEVGLFECKLIEVAWLGLAEVGDVSVMPSLFCTAPSALTLKGLKGTWVMKPLSKFTVNVGVDSIPALMESVVVGHMGQRNSDTWANCVKTTPGLEQLTYECTIWSGQAKTSRNCSNPTKFWLKCTKTCLTSCNKNYGKLKFARLKFKI
jgi:hypothetical protein